MALASCASRQDEVVFFPIDSLINTQIKVLAAREAGLQKQATLGGVMEEKEYTPRDTTAWQKELNIFSELNIINKPANRSSYVVRDGLIDANSNLTVKTFTDTTDQPVRYLRIYYRHTTSKPRIVEARYETDHALYTTARIMRMEFQTIDGVLTLTAYSINGGQKMMLGDSVTYSIKGRIQLN